MPIQKFTVSRDDSTFEAWPDLVQTKSGKLICVFSEGQAHTIPDGRRVVYCISTDRGRTWSEKRGLTEKGTRESFFNCPRISRLKDGRIAVICDRDDGLHGRERFVAVNQYLWFSDDEGESWSEPQVLPFFGIVPDRLLQLKSGRLIVCAHYNHPETGKLEEYLWYSDDDGKTWSDRVILASDPRYNLCEASLIEVEDNKLVAFLRENSMKGYDIMKAISHDGGQTWEGVYPTVMACGHRPTSGFLKDGNALVTYRFIPGNNKTYQTTFAAMLSRDGLLSPDRDAQGVRIMPLDYDRSKNPDTGYTGWTQFEDGEIYVVNYIADDAEQAYIRGYSFYPSDIVLP